MDTVTLSRARKLSRLNLHWCIELRCTEGTSDKFWRAEGHGPVDPVMISWGRRGSQGQTIKRSWSYVEDKVPKKLDKGYQYYGGLLLPNLTFPFDQIRRLERVGGRESNWTCHDGDGELLFEIPAQTAKNLRLFEREYVDVR